LIYVSHTSQHPPISSFYLIGKGWKMDGYYKYVGKTKNKFNAVEMGFEGPTRIYFDDG